MRPVEPPRRGGDVVGTAGVRNKSIARHRGTSGKHIEGSVVLLEDDGSISGVNDLELAGALTLSGLAPNTVLVVGADGLVSVVGPGTVGQVLTSNGAAAPTFQAGGGDGTNGVEGSQYHPDRTPTSGLNAAGSDEFFGNIDAGWTWGNQGATTDTWYQGSAYLNLPNTVGVTHARWRPAPGAVDFVLVTKMTALPFSNSGMFAGLAVLHAGTEAAPTSMEFFGPIGSGSTGQSFTHRNFGIIAPGYNNGATVRAATGNLIARDLATEAIYLAFRYVASSKTLTTFYSVHGRLWSAVGSIVLAAHPTSIGRLGYSLNASFYAVYEWFRCLTGAAANAFPFSCGE